MNLTKNEKRVLRLLLDSARISDSAIAKKLKISSQAVGKIRRKLEGTVIDSYSVNLNYAKLGVQTFAFALAKLTGEGRELGELEVEKKLLDDPNIIQVYRLPNQSVTHVILYGFKDMNDLDSFFHSQKKKLELHRFIEQKEMFSFSHNSLIKSNPRLLFKKVIEDEGDFPAGTFEELEVFKRKLAKK